MKPITLGVKLNQAEATAFQHWCNRNGRNPAEVLGYVIECILKMQGQDAPMNEKLLDAMRVFDAFRDLDRVGSVIAPSSKLEVIETIYFVNERGRRGTMVILVEPSVFDEPSYSIDKDRILSELLQKTNSSLHTRLLNTAMRLDTNGITETIMALLDNYEREHDPIREDIEQMFQDNTRHEFGRNIDPTLQYKRHNRKSIHEPTQLTLFNDIAEHEQRQELSQDNPEREVAEPEPEDEADG